VKKDSSIILRILFVVCLFQLIAGLLYAPAAPKTVTRINSIIIIFFILIIPS